VNDRAGFPAPRLHRLQTPQRCTGSQSDGVSDDTSCHACRG
jgi:hypothetical protein